MDEQAVIDLTTWPHPTTWDSNEIREAFHAANQVDYDDECRLRDEYNQLDD